MTFEELLSSMGFIPKQVIFILANTTFDESREKYVVTKFGKELFTLSKEFVDAHVTETYDNKGNRIPIEHKENDFKTSDKKKSV